MKNEGSLKKFVKGISQEYEKKTGKPHPKMVKVPGKQAYTRQLSPSEAKEKKERERQANYESKRRQIRDAYESKIAQKYGDRWDEKATKAEMGKYRKLVDSVYKKGK